MQQMSASSFAASARTCGAAWIALTVAMSVCTSAFAQDAAKDAATRAARISVTIYEMRSSVAEVPAREATDMFTTALVKTRKFRVLERQRIGEGVARERELNAQRVTTGDAAT